MSEQIETIEELASRHSDKLTVTLWWVKGTIDTFVEVVDAKTEPPTLERIPVPIGSSPNDVFNHPYAYAQQVESA